MGTFLTILGILGISVLPTLIFIIRLIFKRNIEFHKILQSFPLISEHRTNEGSKTIDNDIRKIEISKELTEFAESKKGDLDEFLAKLEKFDESKVRFKKKEITSFIRNVKRLLTSKSSNITIEGNLDLKTNEFSTKIKGKPFEWTACNYITIYEIMKDEKKINKLFLLKLLNF